MNKSPSYLEQMDAMAKWQKGLRPPARRKRIEDFDLSAALDIAIVSLKKIRQIRDRQRAERRRQAQ